MATESKAAISITGDNNRIIIGDNNTVVINHGSSNDDQVISGPVSNCREPVHKYWPRKILDDDINKSQKGKPILLHGTIGTGKTSAILNHVVMNKEKFAISWFIDVSKNDDIIVESFISLAERLGVSYQNLFQTIEQRAKNENVIFLLDNLESKPLKSEWFVELWNIRRSIYIMITTNNPSLNFPVVDKYEVEKFDEALEFFGELSTENNEEDIVELCRHFGWNILGLSVAKDYISRYHQTSRKYLKMQHERIARRVRQNELDNHQRILYESVRACIEKIDENDHHLFSAIAAVCLISYNMIPEFLLSNLLPSSNPLENEADLNALYDQLKSLVRITEENGVRFFSFHSFTQYVVTDMINEVVKSDLLYKLAGIFMKHISKDNRFSKSDFLQRSIRQHAEIFLREWKDKKKDDRTSIALARLSELVGFSYTQQQPPLPDKLDKHFIHARDILHKLCGITDEDRKPRSVGSVQRFVNKFMDYIGGKPNEKERREMYGITDDHLVIAHQLFEKLSVKSSQLLPSIISDLVFQRTVCQQDLAMFPEVLKENKAVKEKIESSIPLSKRDVEMFVDHGAAYSVDHYQKMFLPELYLSVIYSLGRNYFYKNKATIENASMYINLLKRAYCLSREISNKMKPRDSVFHEFVVQTNGLLYLLVNDDCFNEDGRHMKKEAHVHAGDLKNAIDRYKQLIRDERAFFEMGLLKRTKDDTYSKLVCYQQILRCYKSLLSLVSIENRNDCIKDGVQLCDDLKKFLDIYTTQDNNRPKEDLVRYSRHMNAIADFYLSINQEEYYSEVIKIFSISAEHAKKYATALFHLEALVGLADVFNRIGVSKRRFSAIQVSIRHLKRCNSEKSLCEMLHQKPQIQERIRNIQKQNVAMILKRCSLLRRQQEQGDVHALHCYFDESDGDDEQVDSNTPTSSCSIDDVMEPRDEELTTECYVQDTNEKTQRARESHIEATNGNSQQPSSSLLSSSFSQPSPTKTNQDNASSSTVEKLPLNDKEKRLMKLAQEIPKSWNILAKFLGVKDSKIDEITLNNPYNVVRQAYLMLTHWLESHDETTRPWYEELGNALREINRYDLSQDFHDNLDT